MDADRRALLTELVQWRTPLAVLESRLRSLPWDPPDDERVILGTREVLSAIDRALRGDETLEELSHWASLVELREDLDYERANNDRLRAAIFDLANPDVQGALTRDRLREIGRQLESTP